MLCMEFLILKDKNRRDNNTNLGEITGSTDKQLEQKKQHLME